MVDGTRGILVELGAKIGEQHVGFGVAGVLKGSTRLGAGFGAEVFVLGQLVEADELGAVEWLAVNGAFALHASAAPGTFIFNSAFHAGINGEFLGGEKLLDRKSVV